MKPANPTHDESHGALVAAGRTLLFAVVIATASSTLAGCGWFSKKKKEDPIFANTPAGPKTEQLLKQLPKGLAADRENARHTRTPLLPPDADTNKEPPDRSD